MSKKSEIAWRDDLIKDQSEVITELKQELIKVCGIKEAEISGLLGKIEEYERQVGRLCKEVEKSENELSHKNFELSKSNTLLYESEERVKMLVEEAESITIWSILFKPNKEYLWKKLKT